MIRRAMIAVAIIVLMAPIALGENPTLSGPYSHSNLTIYLMHGSDVIPTSARIITLKEALEQKKLIVHETGNVNTLSVENVADDVDVFIHSGDIVKGGKQDRLLSVDMLVPPKSGKLPIPSFCVEQGRWQRRGNESAGEFSGSGVQAANKGVKLAANAARDQSQVWAKVKEAQRKLADNLGKSVANNQSPSSYQLTLEDKDLLAKVNAYVKALTAVAEQKRDAIGFVIVINGKIEGADLYGSHALFVKMWPKLLQGAAVDALTELDTKKKFDVPTAGAIEKFLAEAAKGTEKEVAIVNPMPQVQRSNRGPAQALNPAQEQRAEPGQQAPPAKPEMSPVVSRLRNLSIDNAKTIQLDAKDRKDGKIVHRCIISK